MDVEMVSVSERESLLRNIPFFRAWSVSEIAALAGMMQEIFLESGFEIVKEGTLIDAIYFIVTGEAEVTQTIEIKGKTGASFVTLLNRGESIGLKNAGLFSETGVRTATVTTTEPSLLLKLELSQFNRFLKKHPHLQTQMDNSVVSMLKMTLIKNAAPFARLTNQKIAWIANQVKELSLNPGTTIFKEGDESDACFMVYEGQVEITKQTADGQEEVIATLHPGALFGEAALMTKERRNASAHTIDACRLLIMDREIFRELTKQEEDIPEVLIPLLMERSRPVRAENIIYQQRTQSDGKLIVILKDPGTNNYFQLDEKGWNLWQSLDGESSSAELIKKIQMKFPESSTQKTLEILTHLIEQGFAKLDALGSSSGTVAQNPMASRLRASYFFKNADKRAAFLYRSVGFIFFFMPVVIILALLSASGIYLFVSNSESIIQTVGSTTRLPLLLILAWILTSFFKLLNPLCKALAIKHFRHEIPHWGVIWRGLRPQMILDTSDILVAKRWPRMAVELAGLMGYLLAATLFSIEVWINPNNAQGVFFWICALIMYLEVIRSFDPMLDLEGYHFFMESIDISHLRETALLRLAGSKTAPYVKHRSTLNLFWIYTSIYLCVLLAITDWFFSLVRNLLPNINMLYALVMSMILLAFLVEIVLELRYQKKTHTTVETD